MCFVKEKNGELCGAFEVIQQDINDKKDLQNKITSFLNKIIKIVGWIKLKLQLLVN